MTRHPATIALALCCALLMGGCEKGSSPSSKESPAPGRNQVSPAVAQEPAVVEDAPAAQEPVEASPAEEVIFEEPERVEVGGGEQIQRAVELDDGSDAGGETLVYQVQARSMGGAAGALRIQAVWLFAGGWGETDENGELRRQVVSSRVAPSSGDAQDYELVMPRPEGAVNLVLFLVNEGEPAVEVTRLVVVRRS